MGSSNAPHNLPEKDNKNSECYEFPEILTKKCGDFRISLVDLLSDGTKRDISCKVQVVQEWMSIDQGQTKRDI